MTLPETKILRTERGDGNLPKLHHSNLKFFENEGNAITVFFTHLLKRFHFAARANEILNPDATVCQHLLPLRDKETSI